MSATIEIDVRGRWDAVALMRRLDPYHSYLIQCAPEHWVVHARCPGCHGERVDSALAAIEDSLGAHRIEGAAVRVDGQPVRLAAGGRSSS